MVSDAQQQANEQNAKLAGVRTSAGKAVSRYNSLRHGVLTRLLLVHEQREAQQIQSQMIDEFKPQSIVEQLLIETMTVAYARRQRAIHAEWDYLREILEPAVYEEKIISPPLLVNPPIGDTLTGIRELVLIKPAYKAKINDGQIDVIDKTFARYITSCERQFYRALHELQRIQDHRMGKRPTSVAMDVMSEVGGNGNE